jgi:hypothetical protein
MEEGRQGRAEQTSSQAGTAEQAGRHARQNRQGRQSRLGDRLAGRQTVQIRLAGRQGKTEWQFRAEHAGSQACRHEGSAGKAGREVQTGRKGRASRQGKAAGMQAGQGTSSRLHARRARKAGRAVQTERAGREAGSACRQTGIECRSGRHSR